jgi:lipoprotein-anchoring transpeptidase ErfK/SrfK
VTYRRYRTRPPWRRAATFFALLLAAVAAAAAARADEPGGLLDGFSPARIAEDVTIGGTHVGGMTAEQAATAVRADFRWPVAVGLPGRTVYVSPTQAGGVALVSPAVERALDAAPGANVSLRVLVDRPRLRSTANRYAAKLTKPAVDAQVRLKRLRPVISQEKVGLEVRAGPLARALQAALVSGRRTAADVPHTTLLPDVMRRDIRSVIVIQRSANRLFLYQGDRRTKLGVATGQPIYPTPLGEFTIVDKQLNPWWYPPDSDWAAGMSPIPPGPGNPLGTRWMGLSVPGVGIHGTPDAASIGYSASHGCVRMRIPDAEWLYDRVSIGTPVFIVA